MFTSMHTLGMWVYRIGFTSNSMVLINLKISKARICYGIGVLLGLYNVVLPDVEALEELFVETTLVYLLSLLVWSVKTKLAHQYIQKIKRSHTTEVLMCLC